MNLDGFVKKYLGKKVDWDGKWGGQCTDLFRQYCHDVLEIDQPKPVRGAADFWGHYSTDPNLKNNFKKIKNTPSFVPIKGDVIIWNRVAGGGYGHIAIFLTGNVNRFTSLDQNWPTLSRVTKTKHDYKNIYGILRPNDIIPSALIEPTVDIRIKLLDEYSGPVGDELKQLKTEGEVRDGLGRIKSYKQLQTDKQNADKQIKEFEQSLARIKEDFKIEKTSNNANLAAEKDERVRIIAKVAKDLGSSQDLPSIRKEISILKGKEKRYDSFERQNKTLNQKLAQEILRHNITKDKVIDLNRQLQSIQKELITTKTTLQKLKLQIKNKNMIITSPQGSLIKQDWIKIGRGALLAALVPLVLYILDWLQTIDFGTAWWTPLIAGVVPVLANIIRKYVKENKY